MQIKELTMRISDEGNFKAENLKLREFLRKQSVYLTLRRLSLRISRRSLPPVGMKPNLSASTRNHSAKPKAIFAKTRA